MEFIDFSVIEMLQNLEKSTGENLIEELRDVFISTTDVQIKEMLTAFENGDLQTLGNSAHSLKSSSANIGALKISEAAQIIEKSIRSGEPNQETLKTKIDELQSLFPKTVSELRSL